MLTDKQFITKYRHSKKLLRFTSIKPVDGQLRIGKYKIGKKNWVKPINCFWFACGVGWIDYLYGGDKNHRWFEKENPEMKKKLLYLYEFKLKKDNNVLLVNTQKKLAKFNKKYGNIVRDGYVEINWYKVSKDYDGIIFCPYFKNVIFSLKSKKLAKKYLWYNTLDVPSGCIWNTKVIKKSKLFATRKRGKGKLWKVY